MYCEKTGEIPSFFDIRYYVYRCIFILVFYVNEFLHAFTKK